MSMKPALITLFLLITSASIAQNASTVDADVVAREKQFWSDSKNHDVNALRGLMADDFLAVNMGGTENKQGMLEGVTHLEMSTPALWDWKLVRLSPTSYLVTYQFAASMKYGDESIPGHFYASALWTQQNGQWQMKFQQTTPFDE
ncbi:MAG TPA: nuclear transport factor 2 family protein [Terriglobales bacterium]|nr:nuclear transport factor 2 family protein [Terriglobales bacterium]